MAMFSYGFEVEHDDTENSLNLEIFSKLDSDAEADCRNPELC